MDNNIEVLATKIDFIHQKVIEHDIPIHETAATVPLLSHQLEHLTNDMDSLKLLPTEVAQLKRDMNLAFDQIRELRNGVKEAQLKRWQFFLAVAVPIGSVIVMYFLK